MKIEELIKIIDKGYPNGKVAEYFKDINGNYGDGLARFIAVEIAETFDPDASKEDQIEMAIKEMEADANEINRVICALSEAREEETCEDCPHDCPIGAKCIREK